MTPAPPKSSPSPARLREILTLIAGILLLGGGLYWFFDNQINLTGRVTNAGLPLKPSISGTVRLIPVQKGQSVNKGDPLLFLEDGSLLDALERERQTLDRMEAALPPALLPFLAAPDREGRLSLARQAEEEALRFVGDASAAEAGAAVAARRAVLLDKEGKVAADRQQEALLAHERAKKALDQARAEFEARSLARAALAAELRDLNAALRASGLSLNSYEEQRARTRAAEKALDAAVLRAPEDGIVADVAADPDTELAAGQTALIFLPLSASPQVSAFVSENTAAHLAPGQRCLVRVSSLPDPLEGSIAALVPRPAGIPEKEKDGTEEGEIMVLIRLAPGERPAGFPPLLPDGAPAVITIYLDEKKEDS
jgi:multidrug resistance efflux pump